MVKIAPSLLAADFLNLGQAVCLVNKHADIFHIDVMDGVFVPNISFGFPVVEAVAARAEKPLDVHLMIVEPEKYALKFAAIKGVDMVSFHLDASKDPKALLLALREAGVKAGLVINPNIPVSELFPYLDYCDYVLLMSVYAGFGGQSFIEETFERVRTLKREILSRGLEVEIEVDGGVKTSNSAELVRSGVDIIVAGTAVFKAEDPQALISQLRQS